MIFIIVEKISRFIGFKLKYIFLLETSFIIWSIKISKKNLEINRRRFVDKDLIKRKRQKRRAKI